MRARELISEIVEHATGEPLRNYTAEEWLLEWLQGKKATKAEGTFLKYGNAINGYIASVGNRAKLNVNQIAPRDVLRWRDGQVLDGKSPSTANDHVKIVRMAFTSARRQGFITHNPALLSGFADRVMVLYAGEVAEYGPAETVLASPRHPYTKALFQSIPAVSEKSGYGPKTKLPAILGDSSRSSLPIRGCPFEPRCTERMDICREREPALVNLSASHTVSCFKYES